MLLPEIPMLALSAAAWLVLAARGGTHVHAPGAAGSWWHWMLMVAAMMLPLQIAKIRLTAERSFWSRRHRASAEYLLGYLSVWGAIGVPLAWAFTRWRIADRIDWPLGAAIGFVATAAWLLTPWKRSAARMCHRTIPLSVDGWRADRDCLWFGWTSGCSCALNCWPLMLVCSLSGHNIVAVPVSFALGWTDRHFPHDDSRNIAVVTVLAFSFGIGELFIT
jgi:hypothetical protein